MQKHGAEPDGPVMPYGFIAILASAGALETAYLTMVSTRHTFSIHSSHSSGVSHGNMIVPHCQNSMKSMPADLLHCACTAVEALERARELPNIWQLRYGPQQRLCKRRRRASAPLRWGVHLCSPMPCVLLAHLQSKRASTWACPWTFAAAVWTEKSKQQYTKMAAPSASLS